MNRSPSRDKFLTGALAQIDKDFALSRPAERSLRSSLGLAGSRIMGDGHASAAAAGPASSSPLPLPTDVGFGTYTASFAAGAGANSSFAFSPSSSIAFPASPEASSPAPPFRRSPRVPAPPAAPTVGKKRSCKADFKRLGMKWTIDRKQTDLWGFPVHFQGAEVDEVRRAVAADVVVGEGEQRRMMEVEVAQRQAALDKEGEDRAKDRMLFTYLVAKYGPMPGELYSVSSRPGDIYHKLLGDGEYTFDGGRLGLRGWWEGY